MRIHFGKKRAVIAYALFALTALLHVHFLILEMFVCIKPQGMKVFDLTPELANATKVLAANQGINHEQFDDHLEQLRLATRDAAA